MAGRVAGKVALVAGAARGQGRSHAVRLAEEGADIIAVDMEEMPEQTWQDVIDVNLTGVWHTAKATIKHLRAAGGGSMIITNSVCGLKGMPNIGHYVCPGCRHAMFRMPSSGWPPTNPAM
jgi:(+)-trans-carveol dehydrogenase